MKNDWGKWFVFGQKQNQIGPIVTRKGRKIILVAAIVILAVPVAAWAKGPIVRASTDIWGAIAAFFGF